MTGRDLIDLCVRNLLRRRTRTLLAVIGVVVGTCAIVVMLSIGFALSDNYQKEIESYGNLHIIRVHSTADGAYSKSDKGVLNDKKLKEIEKIDGVEAVTPVLEGYMTIVAGKKMARTEIIGVRPEVLKKFNYKVLEGGRLLQDGDKFDILFGNQVPYWFHNPKSDDWSDEPLDVMSQRKMFITGDNSYGSKHAGREIGGEKVVYKEFPTKAVGVLENPDDDSSYQVYMNIKYLEEIIKENMRAEKERIPNTQQKTYESALVYVGDINKSADVSNFLREEMDYHTYSPSDWLESAKKTAMLIQAILGGIGGISLLVAALGITNTMIMSIYERTKEIGVMKVIGANLRDIRKMFMLEAGLIGFIGGFAGLIFSISISLMMNTVLKDVISMGLDGMMGSGEGNLSKIPIWLGLAAIGFATAIGLVAGYYPAKRAMNLSALESLKNE